VLTGRRYAGMAVTSCPRSRIVPASGRSKPATRRRSVVLPHPDGPSNVTNCPDGTSSETSRRRAPPVALGDAAYLESTLHREFPPHDRHGFSVEGTIVMLSRFARKRKTGATSAGTSTCPLVALRLEIVCPEVEVRRTKRRRLRPAVARN
jgi:hypothetical protein